MVKFVSHNNNTMANSFVKTGSPWAPTYNKKGRPGVYRALKWNRLFFFLDFIRKSF